MFIPTYGILLLIRLFAVITKYTVLDEIRREAKEGKSQRQNPRSITRGAKHDPGLLEMTFGLIDMNLDLICMTPTYPSIHDPGLTFPSSCLSFSTPPPDFLSHRSSLS